MRPPAVAGRFYPGDADELARLVDRLLAAVASEPEAALPVAVIAPHAGFQYSGAVAAAAHAPLARHREDVRRVVVLGPAHFVRLRGMALPSWDAFGTPLGPVPVDDDARTTAAALAGVVVDDEPHGPEHSLETQLPFLQRALDRAVVVLPVAVGDTSAEQVTALLDALVGSATVAVISTDLSHYLDVAAAHERDAGTAEAILTRSERALRPDDACGFFALRGLLRFAADRDLDVRLLRLATSADVGADPHRVVGYGAFAVAAR